MYGPWGMEFWQLIVLVWLFAWMFKPHQSRRFDRAFEDFNKRHNKEKESMDEALDAYEDALEAAETKIEKLEERIRVLERIVTDEHASSSLSEKIDNLRQNNG